jgi:hypothetical protein
MKTEEGRTLESLRSTPVFLDANAARLGGIPQCGQRVKLDALIVQAEGLVGTQSGSDLTGKGATQKHTSLREALLRDHMAPIAGIANAELPQTPELQPLKMPRGSPSIERLRAAALGMAKAAAPYADVFVSSGRPTDFIDQLVAAANATITTVGVRKQSTVVRSGATKGLSTVLSKGRKCVRALDRMVKSALKDDPALLAAWRVASRVAKVGTAAPAAVAPVTTPATASATPATDHTAAAAATAASGTALPQTTTPATRAAV